jgi:lysosomal acid lipase/cholesteryl ester hydrolase
VLPYRLQAVGHSLGAACLLIYAVVCRMRGQPHRLRRLVLLSPAGFHERVPLAVRPAVRLVPVATWVVDRLWPGRGLGLRLPSAALRWVAFKLWADLRHLPALMDLVGAGLRVATSGDASAWHQAASLPHYSAAAMPALSLHAANHFSQWARRPRFALYDYGSAAANRAHYGADTPPSVAEHYGLLDVPVDLLVGSADGLIPPPNVELHRRRLRDAGVRVTLREFAFGHLDFTFGVREEVVRYILARLRQPDALQSGGPAGGACWRQ